MNSRQSANSPDTAFTVE